MDLALVLAGRLPPDLLETVVVGLNLLKGIVGIAIAYIAYRGYRRNRSRPMLFIAGGFALALGIPVVLVFGAQTLVTAAGLPTAVETAVRMTSEVCQVLGLFVILYAIRL